MKAAHRFLPLPLPLLVASCLLALPETASAGAWTRDPGHFFLSTSYFHIRAQREGNASETGGLPIGPYVQHLVAFYGEVGVIERLLTMVLDGTIYRQASAFGGAQSAGGPGDWRLGLWSGLVTRPVRLSLGVTFNFPTGVSSPATAPCAQSPPPYCLPTGDGVGGVEGRLAFGYSFGGWRYWPLRHYLVAEAGYWGRFGGFSDAFVFRAEFGLQLPWKGIKHVWFNLHAQGLESFVRGAELASRWRGDITGIGDGVSYAGYGIEAHARLVKGLGVSLGADSALRSRLVPLGPQIKVGLTYEY